MYVLFSLVQLLEVVPQITFFNKFQEISRFQNQVQITGTQFLDVSLNIVRNSLLFALDSRILVLELVETNLLSSDLPSAGTILQVCVDLLLKCSFLALDSFVSTLQALETGCLSSEIGNGAISGSTSIDRRIRGRSNDGDRSQDAHGDESGRRTHYV
ncbi:hypothetical protein C8J56DRAFT_980096 [Mycena floridula]|nr:hypothetical protein C8J56DRAFT_980096 [Mycena floridula]